MKLSLCSFSPKINHTMRKQIWTEDFKITSYLVNLRAQAGLYSLLSLIQDVGWQHAHHLKVKLDSNLGWVLTRQKLLMSSWPSWNEVATLKTWLRQPTSDTFLYRDYEVYVGNKKIGEATSTFTVFDVKTRKIAKQDWSEFSDIWLPEKQSLTHSPEKILFLKDDLVSLNKFEVRNSDIDLNFHVNNTKYALWILDSIPMEILKNGDHLIGYDVNFLAEAKLGDMVQLEKIESPKPEVGNLVYHFQGHRVSDEKPIFTAHLRTAEKAHSFSF